MMKNCYVAAGLMVLGVSQGPVLAGEAATTPAVRGIAFIPMATPVCSFPDRPIALFCPDSRQPVITISFGANRLTMFYSPHINTEE